MADGREFHADLVISDAGARNTFQRLVRQPQPILQRPGTRPRLPRALEPLYWRETKRARPGTELARISGYIRQAPDHDANLARFLGDPSAPFPVLYISFPSAKDPEFERSHPGRATLEAVVFAPYEWFARWEDSRWKHRAAEYDAFKQALAGRIQREVERHVPAVAGKIDHAELSTPLTTRHFMNYQQGEAYGLAATPERFRIAVPHAPYVHPQSLSHRAGRRLARRRRRAFRWCDDGVRRAAAAISCPPSPSPRAALSRGTMSNRLRNPSIPNEQRHRLSACRPVQRECQRRFIVCGNIRHHNVELI